MDHFLKKIARFSLLGLILFGLTLFMNFFLIRNYPQWLGLPELKVLNGALDQHCAVVLFGSSVNKAFSDHDTDRRSISEMLDSLYAEGQVFGLSHAAYSAEVFLSYTKYILKEENPPVIVVPINLRAFSPNWNLRPEWQFTREQYYIQGYPYLVDFMKLKNPEASTYLQSQVLYGEENLGSLFDLKKSFQREDPGSEKKGFILNYMQPVGPGHAKLKSFVELASYSKKHGASVLFYITPIDFQKAESIGILDFRTQVKETTDLIKSELQPYGYPVLDYSFSLDSHYFHYELLPSEHLTMDGRQTLAYWLSTELKKLENRPVE